MAGGSSSSSSSSSAAAAAAAADPDPPSSSANNNNNNNNTTGAPTTTPMALPPAPKATVPMSAALSHLRSTLTCPLCAEPYTLPHALPSCGHTFCLRCISDHACDSWECPYEGCAVPVTLGKGCGLGGGGRGLGGPVGGGGVSGECCCCAASDW